MWGPGTWAWVFNRNGVVASPVRGCGAYRISLRFGNCRMERSTRPKFAVDALVKRSGISPPTRSSHPLPALKAGDLPRSQRNPCLVVKRDTGNQCVGSPGAVTFEPGTGYDRVLATLTVAL